MRLSVATRCVAAWHAQHPQASPPPAGPRCFLPKARAPSRRGRSGASSPSSWSGLRTCWSSSASSLRAAAYFALVQAEGGGLRRSSSRWLPVCISL